MTLDHIEASSHEVPLYDDRSDANRRGRFAGAVHVIFSAFSKVTGLAIVAAIASVLCGRIARRELTAAYARLTSTIECFWSALDTHGLSTLDLVEIPNDLHPVAAVLLAEIRQCRRLVDRQWLPFGSEVELSNLNALLYTLRRVETDLTLRELDAREAINAWPAREARS